MTSTPLRSRIPTTNRRTDRAGAAFMALGGTAFFFGGALHPSDSGSGDKRDQLHDMLVSAMWYPSHAVLLAAMASIAIGVIAIRRHGRYGAGMAGLLGVVAVTSVLATSAMLVHLFAPTQAPAIAAGGSTFLIQLHTWSETVVNPLWGLAMAALALAGGVTHTVGNRIVLILGVIGGLAFALATATIAFTDAFDPLFAVSSLLGVWAVAAGVIGLTRARENSGTPGAGPR